MTLIMEDGTKYPQTGELTLSEVSVDPGTGTITLRAEFPNPDNILLPGMFGSYRTPSGYDGKSFASPAASRDARSQRHAPMCMWLKTARSLSAV